MTKTSKIIILFILMIITAMTANAATLTCEQITDASLSVPQFSSKNIEIKCTASGGTVSNVQISLNADPSTGLSSSNTQTISSSITDSSSSTAKWSVTGDTPNTYTVSYTISSSATNSWSGASTTSVEVPSPAQLTVEYVLPPSIFTPTVDELDFKINNIGGTTANNVKMRLNDGALVNYPTTIAAGASASYTWTNETGFNESGEYNTSVYIGEILHDTATVSVLTSADGLNQTLGWNLISFPRQAVDMSSSSVLADISGQLDIIYEYQGGITWKSYAPGGAPPTLATLSVLKGYWLKTTTDVTLNISGTSPASNNISLSVGWNLIGYPKTSQTLLETTYTDILGNLDSVWRFDGGITWKSYAPGGSPDTLTTLDAGKGYWVKMTTADNLIITN